MEILSHGLAAFSNFTLHIVQNYGAWGVFFGSFLMGENVILVAFLLGAQGYLTFNPLFPAFMGSLSADFFWYFFNKFLLPKESITNILEKKHYSVQFINFLIRQKVFVTFTFIKLLVGIRLILTVALIRLRKFTFLEYFSLCILSNSIFIFVQYGLAALTQKGVNIIPIYHNLNTVIGIALLLIILIHLMPFFFNYLVTKVKSTS